MANLLDLTLREILEEYCTIHNLECGGYYGVFQQNDVEQIFKEYNIDEYPEAVHCEPLVDDEIIDLTVKGRDSLIRIMENLGINKKEEK